MWIKVLNDGLCNDYETKSSWIGTLFITVGFLLLLYIFISPLAMHAILGVGLLFIGLLSLYFTAKINPKVPVSWSKSLLILLTGFFFLFITTEPTHMKILAILFFMFGMLNNLYLAYLTRQNSTGVAWSIHALLSALFILDVIFNSEQLTLMLLAVFIAINIIVDGIIVMYSGRKVYIRP